LLKIKGLNASYGDVQILFDLSLEVSEREFVSIVGANAAGKSSLLRALSGLLKKASGSIRFREEELLGRAPYAIVGKGIVHIPEGRRVFPMMTVHENLEVGYFTQRSQTRMKESLEGVYGIFPQLVEHRSQIAGSLSGGEQQMLAIARGLMAKPILLTVDEPSLGLAPIVVQKVFQILRKINQEHVTVLLVEQNVFHALQMCHRAYVLQNGRVMMSGTGTELLKNDYLKKAFLGI
jgi:branched-chain amino acid transport system ATP-binding protein